MKDQTFGGSYTLRDSRRGDIRMKEQTYRGKYTRRGHAHEGTNIKYTEETYTQRRHIHGGDIHMKEQTYGETYTC